MMLFRSSLPFAALLVACASRSVVASCTAAAQQCPNGGNTRVLVVGAGMSGLSAGKYLKENLPDFEVGNLGDLVIVESSNRVGGRVRTKVDGFNDPANLVTLEECASWVYDFKQRNPILDLVKMYDIQVKENDFFDFKMYKYDSTVGDTDEDYLVEVSQDEIDHALKDFQRASRDVQREARKLYNTNPTNVFKDFEDKICLGAIEALQKIPNNDKNKWVADTFVKQGIQYLYINFEFAEADVSFQDLDENVYDWTAFRLIDQAGGFARMADDFKTDNMLDGHIQYNTRVTCIEYDYMVGTDYKVKVEVEVGGVGGTNCYYLADYVVLTVPVGSLYKTNVGGDGVGSSQIEFHPDLLYKPETNPLKQQQYIRIYYKFSERLEYDHEFLYTLDTSSGVEPFNPIPLNKEKFDRCVLWSNLQDFLGDNIWECTMVTEGFESLVTGGSDAFLTETQIDNLLKPLRRIFPDQAVNGVFTNGNYDYHSPKLNMNQDSGYGAYSNWSTGKYAPIKNYYHYYGGGPFGVCERDDGGNFIHNGCDPDGIWRLHISGTGSCSSYYEWVHGAYFSGIRTGQYIVGIEKGEVEFELYETCDDYFLNYEVPNIDEC